MRPAPPRSAVNVATHNSVLVGCVDPPDDRPQSIRINVLCQTGRLADMRRALTQLVPRTRAVLLSIVLN